MEEILKEKRILAWIQLPVFLAQRNLH